MPIFEACLLDYGNTIMEFDRPQIHSVRTRLAEALNQIVAPIDEARVADCLDRVCSLPFSGDPPEYRELTPHEQMSLLLRFIYGEGKEFSAHVVHRLDEILQEFFIQEISVDEGTLRFLEGLRRRIQVGLVSNYPCGKSLRRSLRLTGLDRILHPIVISGELGYVKPHESLFRSALDALGVPAGRVLFVGDRWDADMVGARNAGMKTCHHLGFTSDQDLGERYGIYRPDYQIRRIDELEGILFGANGSGKRGEAAAGEAVPDRGGAEEQQDVVGAFRAGG